jgi:hypothetical protein
MKRREILPEKGSNLQKGELIFFQKGSIKKNKNT